MVNAKDASKKKKALIKKKSSKIPVDPSHTKTASVCPFRPKGGEHLLENSVHRSDLIAATEAAIGNAEQVLVNKTDDKNGGLFGQLHRSLHEDLSEQLEIQRELAAATVTVVTKTTQVMEKRLQHILGDLEQETGRYLKMIEECEEK